MPLTGEEIDQYSVEDLEKAIARCDENIKIFTGEVDKQQKLKMEFQLLLMQKQSVASKKPTE